MRNLTRICVGTNFSPEAEAAVSSAVMLARETRAALDLVHVVHRPALYERALARHAAAADLVAQAEEHLRRLVEEPTFAGLEVRYHVRPGAPFASLIGLARELGAQLLVVGARRRTGLSDWLIGSTAERVLRKASVPVLLARRALPARPACVIAPTDFSDSSRPALEEAIALARRWGARLVLLHVIEPIVQAYAWATDLAGGEIYVIEPEELQPEWDALLAKVDLSGVNWEQRTIKGEVATTISGTAHALGAELIVVGTHGRTGLPHVLLGSVAEGVARAAETNVLAVRTGTAPFVMP